MIMGKGGERRGGRGRPAKRRKRKASISSAVPRAHTASALLKSWSNKRTRQQEKKRTREEHDNRVKIKVGKRGRKRQRKG